MKLGLGLGLMPGAAGAGTPQSISLSRTTVDEDLAVNTGVGLLSVSWLGRAGTGTFSITADPDNKFAISGDELIIDQALSYSTATSSHAVTVQFTPDGGGDPISQEFTINVTEVDAVTEPDLGTADGAIVVGQGFTVTPQVSKSGGDLRIQGKSGGVAKFVFDIGTPTAGATYTVQYDADWSLLSNAGRDVMVGFGFLDESTAAEDFHFAGLKGNGGSGVNIHRISGDGSFRGSSGFTQTAGSAAAHGTQSGPNWIQLTIAEDGLDYILRTSSDGVTWTDELSDIVPSPFLDAETPASFGIAVFMPNTDKGSFTINISAWTNTAAASAYPDPVFVSSQSSTALTTSYSFNSIDISAAVEHASRWLIIGVSSEYATGSSIPTSVTVDVSGGASAIPAERIFAQGGVYAQSLWCVYVPEGSTIDVNVTFAAARGYVVLPVWALYTDADPAQAYSVAAADPNSVTLQTINRLQLGSGNTFMIATGHCIDNAPLFTCTYTGANSLTINERVNININIAYNVAWWDALPTVDEIDASLEIEQTGAGATMYAWAVVFTIGPVAVDPFAADVVFLSHFEGGDGATSYSEETANAYAGTFYGNAEISNSPSPWDGETSLYVGTGSSIDGVAFPDAPILLLDFTEPWTVEFVINLSNTTGFQYIIGQWDTTTNNRGWCIGYNGGIGFFYSTNGVNQYSTTSAAGVVAGFNYPGGVQFDGTNVRTWLGDWRSGALTPVGSIFTPSSAGKLVLGNMSELQNLYPLRGNIDRLRITKGNYRYGMLDSYYGPRRFPAVVTYPDPVYIGHWQEEPNLSSYSFNGLDISAASEHSRRQLIIGVSWANTTRVTGVTVDLDSSTTLTAELVLEGTYNTLNTGVTLWAVDLPTGTTIDVNVTLTGTSLHCGVDLWAIYSDVSAVTPFDQSIKTANEQPMVLNQLLVEDDTFVIAGSWVQDTAALHEWTWTGSDTLTERSDTHQSSSYNYSWADMLPTTAETGTVSISQPGYASIRIGMAVAFKIGPKFRDPYLATEILRCDFEGADGATSYREKSWRRYSATFGGAAQISTAQARVGSSSLYFPGSTAGDYVDFEGMALPAIDFTEPFSIELWMYFDGSVTTSCTLIGQWDEGGNQRSWAIEQEFTSGWYFRYSTTGSSAISTVTTSFNPTSYVNQWLPVSVVFDGSQLRFRVGPFNNAVSKITPAGALHVPSAGTYVRIGDNMDQNGQFIGYIDQLRIVKGASRMHIDDLLQPKLFG